MKPKYFKLLIYFFVLCLMNTHIYAEPAVHGDDRGYFIETLLQVNHTDSNLESTVVLVKSHTTIIRKP